MCSVGSVKGLNAVDLWTAGRLGSENAGYDSEGR